MATGSYYVKVLRVLLTADILHELFLELPSCNAVTGLDELYD